MGDLVGEVVAGNLVWVPLAQFEQILSLKIEPERRAQLFADACRLNVLYMIARAGSGHLGSSFSSLDIVTWLHLNELELSPTGIPAPNANVYFSSKGHDAPGLYAVRLGLGLLPFALLHQLRVLKGLPGHPDVGTPGMVANTGSLGMGISKAKGMAWARRQKERSGRIYVLTGDGELQEGQIWESLVSAANHKLSEITVIVDHNKLQSDTFVAKTSELGDLVKKFEAFGWAVFSVDGHDYWSLGEILAAARAVTDRPQVIIAHTIKGRGVSFMEHTSLDSDVSFYRFHSGAPDSENYQRAAEELIASLHRQCDALGVSRLHFESQESAAVPTTGPKESLIGAYSRALLSQMGKVPNLVVMDADLLVDTGQLPARDAYPERFIECGIAEMDMVSQAGSLAREGFLPICHSFACFLSTRANEQIYNNATEHSRVIYTASLAGLLPAGPGHSHQSVRDISAVGAIPGLILLEPSTEAEVARALEWAIERAPSSVWLRLVSIPCEIPFQLPESALELGKGTELREGADAVIIAYGPVLLAEAWNASLALEAQHGLQVGVVSLPWLNRIDEAWLARVVGSRRHVFTLDNHYVLGGQGQLIGATVAALGLDAVRVHNIGIESVPACGRNQEVLQHHGLDAANLVQRVRSALGR
ncbi:MAG: transketolase C-terminal domain-containing protein [Polyangiaceae bacterium]|nr:transketolase C-terminal domain-containing protein [Polyangiaceae bacterium]